MLTIVIPTLDAADALAVLLGALAQADGHGFEVEIVVADGGSRDATAACAEAAGARVIAAPCGRGRQLAAGAEAARGDWLLFLHADTVPGTGWAEAVGHFMEAPGNRRRAAAFRFGLDDPRPAARRLERLVAWRCRALGLPYGDQGLLLAHDFYDELGGFPPLPLMEDVALVRRIGRRRLVMLDVAALTSAARYQAGGYLARPLRNLVCVGLYFLGLPPGLIARLYA